ncbi:DNA-binding protein [Mycoplasma sp. E35C]|uniref:DNA-binding protein n=1 Tax=Mycoplasma sp. E35C TaxID=2801918 RepID=UPI001CA46C64|nr:DNA-binding protein [Mycoplasma sp. E35C]QZX49281.1 DNA-binding protein [Mycoplasma sp. E35C]
MNKPIVNLQEWDYLNRLFSYYEKLLSSKTKQYLEEYLINNLSYNEIATNYQVSKHAVYDQIKKGIIQLKDYEALLQLLEQSNQRMVLYQMIDDEQLKAKLINLETK